MSTDAPDLVNTLSRREGPEWFLSTVRTRTQVTADDIRKNFSARFVEAVGAEQIVEWVNRMAAALEVVEPLGVVDGRLRVPFRPVGSVPRFRVVLGVDDAGRIEGFDFGPLEVEGVDLQSLRTATVEPSLRPELHDVFAATYRNPDHDYLDESLERLDLVAVGRSDEGELAGFALGAWRRVDLPRKPAQVVKLAGLACVHPDFRRRGLASRLGELAIAGGDMPAEIVLFGGRMAHPASYRQASARVGSVPRPDRAPNSWQRACGEIVAELLGVTDFDSTTFVCRGRGRPIGDPVVEVDVAPEEWTVFGPVDRSRGDTLLAIWWGADPGPEGWIDED